MTYLQIYLLALLFIVSMMSLLWLVSILLKNVSIVDLFWGFGFVLASGVYFVNSDGCDIRKWIVIIMVSIWGLRLSGYLAWRNYGKEEDFRYQKFRKQYGPHRYWWISFFQTFLLQGVLMWIISAPLLSAQYDGSTNQLNAFDAIGIIFWLIGFIFEMGGDWQLARFKANPANKGKVLNQGFWKYTRHPNYFGDAAVWWGYGFMSLAAGSYLPVLSSLIMTALILKVSGVVLLEKTLKETKPEYSEYIRKTSAFIPWFPKKTKKVKRMIEKNIWLILFIVWGLPLTVYRSRFRKMVYQTDRWSINLKPVFGKELKGLFGNIYPDNEKYIKIRNFYRMYLSIYIILFGLYSFFNHSTTMNEVTIGSSVPRFILPDQQGNNFVIDSVIGRKNLVIYFYPKDDSPGCTKEACYFRDQFDVFNQADALIIGISGQSVNSHRKFADKYHLSYTLLSDEENKVRKQFGVPTNFLGLLPGRVTYIVDKTGKIVYIFNSQTQAAKHVDEALRILKEME